MTEKEHAAWQAGWQSAILDMVNEDKYAGLITEHHKVVAQRDQLREALEIITKSVEDTQRLKGIGPRDHAAVQIARAALAEIGGQDENTDND